MTKVLMGSKSAMLTYANAKQSSNIEALINHLTQQLGDKLTADAKELGGQIAATSAPTVYLVDVEHATSLLVVVSGAVSVHYLSGNHVTESLPRERGQQPKKGEEARDQKAISAIVDQAIDAIDQGGGLVTVKAEPPKENLGGQVFTVQAKDAKPGSTGQIRQVRRTVVKPTEAAVSAVKSDATRTEKVTQSVSSPSTERGEPSLRGILED